MKLATFIAAGETQAQLGFALDDHTLLPFAAVMHKAGMQEPALDAMHSYLAALPHSHERAKAVRSWALAHRAEVAGDELAMQSVRFLPAIPAPPVIWDFGLSPRHARNSAVTLLRHTYGALIGSIVSVFVKWRITRMMGASAVMYYKCNHCTLTGEGDTVGWPAYTSYLDIEAELAVVAGTAQQSIAGYVIFNDVSARDIQMPEMMGTGPARSKDFSRGNGLSAFLVTPDELPDPRKLAVQVKIGERFSWHSSTSEYTRSPEELMAYVRTIFEPLPGSVFGMGTIPDCTGLDHDQWLHPGDTVDITIEGLGTLRQHIPSELPKLQRSPWRRRPELARFY